MHCIRAALLLALILYAANARAEDSAGQFAVKGVGFLPCKVFVAEHEKKSATYGVIAGWIQGYITAYNRHVPDTYDITSFESLGLLLAVMKNYCDSHLNDRLYPVLYSILVKLHPDRVAKQSDLVKIVVENQTALLYSETIRRMQAELTQRGFYDGTAGGQFTDETKAALIAFQSEIGFTPTGFPDQRTLWRLLRK